MLPREARVSVNNEEKGEKKDRKFNTSSFIGNDDSGNNKETALKQRIMPRFF
jgi:hypothetical protein